MAQYSDKRREIQEIINGEKIWSSKLNKVMFLYLILGNMKNIIS
jgi:hypothetical protein